ncbi:MAG: hypothetical protein AAGD14_10485 [Planctomycetota bacterium]
MVTREDFALISVRLVALLEIASGIHTASQSIRFWADDLDMQRHIVVGLTITSFLPLLVGVALFLASKTIAAWILPKRDQEAREEPDNASIHSVVTGLIGIYCLTFAIPNLLSRLLVLGTPEFGWEASAWYESMPFVRDLISLGFALTLFLGASFWTKLFFKARDFGHEDRDGEPPPSTTESNAASADTR